MTPACKTRAMLVVMLIVLKQPCRLFMLIIVFLRYRWEVSFEVSQYDTCPYPCDALASWSFIFSLERSILRIHSLNQLIHTTCMEMPVAKSFSAISDPARETQSGVDQTLVQLPAWWLRAEWARPIRKGVSQSTGFVMQRLGLSSYQVGLQARFIRDDIQGLLHHKTIGPPQTISYSTEA